MDDIINKRFWALIHAGTQTSREAKLSMLSQSEARVLFEDGRLIVILKDFICEKRALENLVKVLLNEKSSNDIDVIIMLPSDTPLAPLEGGQYEVPWPNRLSLSTIDENGKYGELTKGQSDNFLAKIIDSSLTKDLSDYSLEKMQNEVKAFVRKEREKMGQILRFQSRLQASDSVATHALLAIIGLFYLAQLWIGGPDFVPGLVRMGANSSTLVNSGEYWRLITSIFLHGGFVHLLANSYVLYALGIFFNKIIGNTRFVTVFFLSGIAGSLGSVLIGGSNLSVGASGALWGLFGLGGALAVWPSSFLPDTIRQKLKRVTLINLALNLAISFLPMVDIWAHLGGGIAGFALGLFYVYQDKNPNKNTFNAATSYALSAIAVICVSFGIYTQTPWKLLQPLSFISRSIEDGAFAVDIPSLISSVTKEGPSTSFGSNFDPFRIKITRIKEPSLPQDKASQYAILQNEINNLLSQIRPSNSKTGQEEINGWPTVSAIYSSGQGDKSWLWLQAREGAIFSVFILSTPNTPDILLQDLSRVIRSLQPSISI